MNMMIYDVAIVGAGVIGCMTAYRLAKYDLHAVVLEAAYDVARGASGANSAIVHAGYDPVPGTVKALMNVRGCAAMPDICAELDVPYRNTGSLTIACGPEQEQTLRTLYDRGIANGVPGLRILSREEVRAAEPNISEDVTAALEASSAGILCPYTLTIAAAENAAVNGTSFRLGFRVDRITRDQEGIFTLSAGGESVRARMIVNAAGTGADIIADLAGETDFPARIIPRRGEYMLLDKNASRQARHTIFSVPTENGKGVLVSPTVHGNLIVGPNAHEVADRLDTATTADGLTEIGQAASHLVKTLDLHAVITSFAGVRPTSSYGDFYIRPSETIPGLLHLAGIESPGLASSPAISEEAVRLLGEMGLPLHERAEYKLGRPPVIRFEAMNAEERAALAQRNPAYAKIVCRCESVTEGEIIDAIHRPIPAVSVDMVKRRTRAGMGRCQGGFCSPRVAAIIARELNIPLEAVTKSGGGSYLVK